MTTYLYAIQSEDGREVCSWQGEVDKVGDVTAEIGPGNTVHLRHGSELVATGATQSDAVLTLHRWGADKLADPVSHPVAAD